MPRSPQEPAPPKFALPASPAPNVPRPSELSPSTPARHRVTISIPTQPIPPFQPRAPSLAPPVQSNADRFTETPPSLGGRPSLVSRTSMPSGPARRTRASSFSPIRRTAPSPGPSDAGQLDPDHHWLSEDEAIGPATGTSRTQRRAPARRRGQGGSGGGSDNDDEDGMAMPMGKRGLATFGSTTHRSHPIHHRPSGLVAHSDEYVHPHTSTEPPLSHLIPLLIPLVTCASCDRLFVEPSTLNCGHSLCIGCTTPVIHRANDSSKPLHPSSLGISPSESQFARNPSTPLPPPSSMARAPSAGSLVSSLLHRSRSNASSSDATPPPMQEKRQRPLTIGAATLRTRIQCPQPSCKTGRERFGPVYEPKVDVSLHKVMDLLRSTIPGIDKEVERAYAEQQEEVEFVDADEEAMGEESMGVEDWSRDQSSRMEIERTRSGSSGGGEDDTMGDGDDSKRAHRTRAWSSSKRTKRPSSHPRTTVAQRLQLDLSPPDFPESSSFLSDLLSELECQICVQLFHEPVTSPCGHTFCQTCLARAYDHSDKCPLCRADFPSFTYFQSQPINSTLRNLITTLFPSLSAERLATHQAENQGDRVTTPLFICTLSWPNLPTYIHIFEPRYRLMIRRALVGDRTFGMVLPSRAPGEVNEYGTMLYIQSCNMIEDGRSIIECIGTYRFKVLERGTLDGYTVGRIERIEDIEPEMEDELERRALESNFTAEGGGVEGRPLELSTEQLMRICLDFVQTLRSGSAPWVIQRLNNTIGPMPEAPADFSFWMAEVMPVDDQVKAALLQIRSPRERLRLIVFWIEQFRGSWWFSRGCTIM
ncbi:hypothetical protein BCR35DRAFT_332642 [Leucosporidium creatinivorum]|uniref:PUA-like domain-containing protein n=1 Tax=Leucosporidium creatinivorum TaxID=106004 RepID=A0A1Y2F040_9BASI|nr:hypothetical protein BCR35DRAFT_332642 [Leucosporidium creatinivorum]